MVEVLKNSVLDMTLDVMGTESVFTHPYTVALDLRTSWKATNLENPETWWCGTPTALGSVPDWDSKSLGVPQNRKPFVLLLHIIPSRSLCAILACARRY